MTVALTPSSSTFKTPIKIPINRSKTPFQSSIFSPLTLKFPTNKTHNLFILSSSSSSSICCVNSPTRTRTRTRASSTSPTSNASTLTLQSTPNGPIHHWMVTMERPPQGVSSKSDIINFYVKTLERVLGSETDAQMCIYDASCDTHFGFCCDIDEQTSRELASIPGVLSVRPDPDFNSVKKDYSYSKVQSSPLLNSFSGNSLLFPLGNSKHWLVRIERPAIGVITKSKMVDYCTQVLTKVMGNEQDAQMCIYHVSWESDFGFCCELDDECARDLAGVPVVLSIQPDENFEMDNKNYGGPEKLTESPDSSAANEPINIKTKKLFVTGLSFYTSEKTLRAAFEGFGELVEVKIIMDKISKRSKGFAFIEYTTEAAASAALKEMNGKIINGWMIVVDVAKTTPPKHSRGRPRPSV